MCGHRVGVPKQGSGRGWFKPATGAPVDGIFWSIGALLIWPAAGAPGWASESHPPGSQRLRLRRLWIAVIARQELGHPMAAHARHRHRGTED